MKIYSTLLLFFLLLIGCSSSFKINKNTVEMLNNGLKALVSIKRILSTLKSVNELSVQAFPNFSATRPRIRFMQKLLGVSSSKGAGTSSLSSTSGSTAAASNQVTKRNPSIGMIKIGEKPPPGLFPETLPYTLNSAGSPMSISTSATDLQGSSSTLNPTIISPQDIYSKLHQAGVNHPYSDLKTAASQLVNRHFNSLDSSSSSNSFNSMPSSTSSSVGSGRFMPSSGYQALKMFNPYADYHSSVYDDMNDGNQMFEGTYDTFHS